MDGKLLNQAGSQISLHKAILGLKSEEELKQLFSEILSPNENKDLELRWALLQDLVVGKTQRRIALEHGISLCKITRGARILRDANSLTSKILKASID